MKNKLYLIIFINFTLVNNIFANGNHEHGNHNHGVVIDQGFVITDLIAPLGITTLTLLLLTFSMGFYISKVPKKRKLILPWHKRVASLTVILALSHAIIVIFFH